MSNPVVLYVEDEESDVLLLRLAAEIAGITFELKSVRDGEQARSYLTGRSPFSNRDEYPLPDVVLLDLNLPGESGFDVLGWIREQPSFGALPIVIYTSSVNAGDHDRACRLGADDYVVKLSDVNDIANFARYLESKWIRRQVSD